MGNSNHHIWTETLPGLSLRYVAQRKRGTSARPYLVVTADLEELRTALPTPAPGSPSSA